MNPKRLLCATLMWAPCLVFITLPAGAYSPLFVMEELDASISPMESLPGGEPQPESPSLIQVGELVFETHESAHPYSGAGVVWEREFHWLDAGYISLHFSDFDLLPGDYLEITDPDRRYVYRYSGKGKVVRGGEEVLSEFWAVHIPGDRAIARLVADGMGEGWGIRIDRWAHGYAPEVIDDLLGIGQEEDTRAICGQNDMEWAMCYEGTEIYQRSRAVARLLIQGTSGCTGWLLGSEGHIMTNNHCIGSQGAADNTDYELMAEGETCDTDCSGWMDCPGIVEATSGTLVRTNGALDYSLIKLPTDITPTYGYLQLRETLAEVGERIYIPQHPGLGGKRIAVLDDQVGGNCEVHSTDESPCHGGPGDIGYLCDTDNGSSGSPVIAYSDHLVVALHHCAYCPNRGVPIPSIISDLGNDLPPDAIGFDIVPDIRANGSDGPITIASDDTLIVTVALDAGNATGEDADWWLAARASSGRWYFYQYEAGWSTQFSAAYQGRLINLPTTEVLNMSGLVPDTYVFYFGVDLTMNGSLDPDRLYRDQVEVQVNAN